MANYRLTVVDALRGFAIVSIMLLHNIEHFDLYYLPPELPNWVKYFDSIIWDSLFFLFGGKSYAIFAVLFGLTFFIQLNNRRKKGERFYLRFAWRLVLLFCFGIINSAFFQGDILTLYAIVGFFIIPISMLKDKYIFIITIFLFLQPYEIIKTVSAIITPIDSISNPVSWGYFGKMGEYITKPNIIDTIVGNLTNGKTAVVLWNWENGRFFHMLALFLSGYLAGKKNLFDWNSTTKNIWRKTLIFSSFLFIPLFISTKLIDSVFDNAALVRSLTTAFSSYSNISFMLVILSLFVISYYHDIFPKIFKLMVPIGKMSLSNYVFQSILGALIYYGFGLGLYKYTGALYGVGIAFILTILTWSFCSWWDNRFKRGPLETIWHYLTWIKINN